MDLLNITAGAIGITTFA
jgi:hypothetical protein